MIRNLIAIADSGSTKTSWVFIDKNNHQEKFQMSGINPFYQSTEEILQSISAELLPSLKYSKEIEKIYFYGAGVLGNKKELLISTLNKIFPSASKNIYAESDLLAAARALLGNKEGIACIAGTGSNSCYYNGKDIIQNIRSLGLFLGDEGSGGFLGKLLVRDYIRETMPSDARIKFEAFTSARTSEILDKIYLKPFPNRYLATFVPLMVENQKEEYFNGLAQENFKLLYENCICRYPQAGNFEINFVGSVAFKLKAILEKVTEEKGLQLGKILQNPLDALIELHK